MATALDLRDKQFLFCVVFELDRFEVFSVLYDKRGDVEV